MPKATKPLTSTEINELKQRLEILPREALILLASRFALRAFPVLAKPSPEAGFFGSWAEVKKCKNLLAIWRALIATQASQAANSEYSYIVFEADSSAYYAADSAFYAAQTMHNSDRISEAVYLSIDASIRALDEAVDIGVSIRDILLKELYIIEQNEFHYLSKAKIWLDSRPSETYINIIEEHLPKALNQLSLQSRESDLAGAALIEQIYPLYMGLYKGKSDKQELTKALTQLDRYFDDDKKEQSEAAKKSDDVKLTGGIKSDVDSDSKLKIEEIRHLHSLSQNEDNHAKEDKLNRSKLVATLADMLSDASNSHHQTIGLLGDWGSGKSSIIAQLKEVLLSKKGEQPFLFAEFNAWEYEHTDNIQAGIAQEMIKALTSKEELLEQEKADYDRQGWIGKLGDWLLWQIDRAKLTLCFAWRIQGFQLIWLILLFFSALIPICPPILELLSLEGFLNGVGEEVKSLLPIAWTIGIGYPLWQQAKKVFAGPLAKELRTYLKLPDYAKHLGMIPVMQDHIKKLVDVRLNTSKSKKRILYVVDDLDRCSHEGIVKVLEAVRLVLGLSNVTVIIAVDQRIAMAALALHYQELEPYHAKGDARQIARDYLAKIIHFPIQLTKLDQASVSGYLASLWQHDTVEEILDKRPTDTDKTIGTEPDKELPVPSAPDLVKEPRNPIDDERNETLGDDDVEKKVTVIERLSPAQQEAFKHWVLYFDLTNPRQLKRLNNSYIFLLNYHQNDELPDRSASVHSPVESGFPILATLCALEYLNDLDDRKLRHVLKQQLEMVGGYSPILKEDKEKRDSSKITGSIIVLAGTEFNTQTVPITAFKAVEPFVLPALDSSSES